MDNAEEHGDLSQQVLGAAILLNEVPLVDGVILLPAILPNR
jgi:hypothetical protein